MTDEFDNAVAAIDGRHAPPIDERLSCDPAKRALFGCDSYFRDSWEDLLSVAGADAATALHNYGSLLLKPDAVAARRLEPAIDWLADHDVAIVGVARPRLTPQVIRALWQYQWNLATRSRRDLADRLMSMTESLLLVVRMSEDELPATIRLTELKGPADPTQRQPGQLRHHLGNHNYLLNFVHTTDEPADLIREIGVLVSADERCDFYRRLLAGDDEREAGRDAARALHDQVDEQDLSLAGLERRLAARGTGAAMRQWLSDAHAGQGDWREVTRVLGAAGVVLEPWDEIALGTHLLVASEAGRAPVLPGISRERWRDQQALLDARAGTASADRHAEAEDVLRSRLDRQQTIPRQLVHKSGIAEVFISDWARIDERRILLAGELPRAHYYYDDVPAELHYELMPVCELCRQACFVTAHSCFGAPLDRKFILRTIEVEMQPRLADSVASLAPRCVTVACDIEQVWRKEGAVTGLSWRFEVSASAQDPIAVVRMSMSWMDPEAWEELRRESRQELGLPRQPGPRVALDAQQHPSQVGRGSARNVVIGLLEERDGCLSAPVSIDSGHAPMFEHFHDHVPGMLELEAARQVGIAAVARAIDVSPARVVVDRATMNFRRFGELDLSIDCAVEFDDAADDGDCSTVELMLQQQGTSLCSAGMHFGVLPAMLSARRDRRMPSPVAGV